jgi:hypothetical protein
MTKVSRMISLLSLLGAVLVLASAQTTPQREKVAEGQYSEWKDGHPIQDSTQSWTLWRVADGFELEDRLPPNKGAMMMAAMGKGLGSSMSAELRRDIQNAATLTEIDLKLAKDRSPLALTLRGIKLSEQKPNEIVIAQCDVMDTQIACKGRAGRAHLIRAEQQQLFYSHPFPLLFSSVLLQKELTLNQPSPLKLDILEGEDKKLVLTEVSSQITHLGQEQLVIGQYTFQTEKYLLTMETKDRLGTKTTSDAQTEHRQVTLWASRQGIVFAMEDSRFVQGLRVNLTQYKKYSEF